MIVALIIITILALAGLIGGIITIAEDGDSGLAWTLGAIFGACFIGSCVIFGELGPHQLEVKEYTVDKEVTVVNGDTTCVKYIINYKQ